MLLQNSPKNSYEEYRSKIKSGDLLIWANESYENISDIMSKVIQAYTRSSYTHVGVAWVVGERVFVIEAIPPSVRIYPLSKKRSFYHIDMGIKWDDSYIQHLLEKVGDDYGYLDVLRSIIYAPKEDNSWHCVELATDFYEKVGIYTNEQLGYTPKSIVDYLLSDGKTLNKVLMETTK